MKDYYLLIGLNSKEIKILDVRQNTKDVIEVEIENRKNKIRCIIVTNLQVQFMIN